MTSVQLYAVAAERLVGVSTDAPFPGAVLAAVADDGVQTLHGGSKSWPLAAKHLQLTSAAVYSHKTSAYAIAVLDKGTKKCRVLFWADSDEGTLAVVSSELALVLPSGATLLELLPLPDVPDLPDKHDFVAVLSDATVLLLCSRDKSIMKLHTASGQTALFAAFYDTTLHVAARTAVDAVASAAPTPAFVHVVLPFGSNNSRQTLAYPFEAPEGADSLLAFAAADSVSTCVWGDGTVTVARLAAPDMLPTVTAKLRLRDFDRPSHTGRKLRRRSVATGCAAAAAALSKACVAIVSSSAQESALTCMLLDTTYGTPLSVTEVELSAPSPSGVARLQIAACRLKAGVRASDTETRELAVVADGRVMLVEQPTPPSSLATALGSRARGSAHHAADAPQHSVQRVPSNSSAHAAVMGMALPPVVAQDMRAGRATDLPVASVSRTQWTLSGPSSKVTKAIDSLEGLIAQHGDESGSSQPFKVAELSSGLARTLEGLGAAAAAHVAPPLWDNAARVLADAGQWDALHCLADVAPALGLSKCHGTLTACVDGCQFALLAKLLAGAADVHVDDLTSVLLKLLDPPRESLQQHHAAASDFRDTMRTEAQALLDEAETKSTGKLIQRAATAAVAVDRFSAQESLLHGPVAAAFDSMLLVHACRALSMTGARRLAVYLAKWVLAYSSLPGLHGTAVIRLKTTSVPSISHVLHWFQALLDARFVLFATDAALASTMEEVRIALEAATSAFAELGVLTGLLQQIDRTPPAPVASGGPAPGWSVDWLDLSVNVT